MCDGDGPSVSRVLMVKARKEHRCCECRTLITKGTVHELYSGLWDGSWDEYRTCPGCLETREARADHCWVFGQLLDDRQEVDAQTEHERLVLQRWRWRWDSESEERHEGYRRTRLGVGRIPEVVA